MDALYDFTTVDSVTECSSILSQLPVVISMWIYCACIGWLRYMEHDYNLSIRLEDNFSHLITLCLGHINKYSYLGTSKPSKHGIIYEKSLLHRIVYHSDKLVDRL